MPKTITYDEAMTQTVKFLTELGGFPESDLRDFPTMGIADMKISQDIWADAAYVHVGIATHRRAWNPKVEVSHTSAHRTPTFHRVAVENMKRAGAIADTIEAFFQTLPIVEVEGSTT